MSSENILELNDPRATLETSGGKGASLARLARAGLPVPGGFHITTAAYRQFVADNELEPVIRTALETIELTQPATLEGASEQIRQAFMRAPLRSDLSSAIREAYAALPGSNPAVAVRSSATAEDLPEASFAGQQETYLNIDNPSALLEAVKKCWGSLWTGRAIAYRARQGIAPQNVALAVVIQLLVPAEAAGILFTADPVHGQRQQALISAAWGLGEAIVGGLVTPDTLLVDKATGRLLERQIADKQVMTVQVEGGTREELVPESLRSAPVLTEPAAAELTRLAVQIEELYGMPMDIEWALVDGKFAILQARPITALPALQVSAPTEWRLPDPKGQYLRGSVVDFMPGPLSPLFASLMLPSMMAEMDKAIERVIGMRGVVPPDYFSMINGYAYMSSNFAPGKLLVMMARMATRLNKMVGIGEKRVQEVLLPAFKETIARWRVDPLSEYSSAELWRAVQELVNLTADFVATLQTSTMGAAGGSEALFTNVYDKLVKQPDDPSAPTFLMGFDNLPLQSEKALYDLALFCRDHTGLSEYLKETSASQLAAQWKNSLTPTGVDPAAWGAWQSRFQAYLDEFGHSIYELDFMKPIPADEPAPLLEMLRLFMEGTVKSPYDRQQAAIERREAAMQTIMSRTKGLKLKIFRTVLRWAQHLSPWREDGIANIGLGYPLLREMLAELGGRFAHLGWLEQAEDIYWLTAEEVERSISGLGDPLFQDNIRLRKELRQAQNQVSPPPILPPKKRIWGIKMDAFVPADNESQTGGVLKGLGASPGKVTGRARLLAGPQDFDQMRPGEILVATNTTPAWTPLFAMASAIVTDIGGPLSHGSIVAREYGIPAVLGTGVATRRIHSGQLLIVDGSAGIVRLGD
jgi:rifampicin phosphotransferase